MLSPIYNVQAVRELEQASEPALLMEEAGLAVANLAHEILVDRKPTVLVIAGPGNNGGDAFVAARWLRSWFYKVSVVFLGEAERLASEARAAYSAWTAGDGKVLSSIPLQSDWGLVIDGLFGIGLNRPPGEAYAHAINAINRFERPILAVDIPSGLHADTGQTFGVGVCATHTLTFIALKPGLLTNDGPDHCGELSVNTLSLDPTALRGADGFALSWDEIRERVPRRRRNSHKGTYGTLGIVGGASTMVGAALLAGRAALKLGAGKVNVGLLAKDPPSADWLQPELMLHQPLSVFAMDTNAIVLGPGLGRDRRSRRVVARAIACTSPLVIDADALNILAEDKSLAQALACRNATVLLTPHPAEAARLLETSTSLVQNDRVKAALSLSKRFQAGVVLKGAGSVCAFANGEWYINTTGNAGLATAGTGDVLSGFLGALLAQGLSAKDALLMGVCLHGAAADKLVQSGRGPIGLTASELIDAARSLINTELAAFL